MTAAPFLFADVLADWTKWLAIATFVAVAVAVAGLIWSIRSAASDRKAADKRLADQKTSDDERAERQIAATQESAAREIAAAQARFEAERLADDGRASREIAAAKDAADRQVTEMRSQLDAANRPLLIEVDENGPIYPDMGARPNPNLRPRSTGTIPDTITVRFGVADAEIDPRETYVKFTGGLAHVSVPLRNVGRGLACVHSPGVRFDAENIPGTEWLHVRRERVPVGESTRISLIVRYPTGIDIPSLDGRSEARPWVVHVPYTDFAGQQPAYASIYLTRATNDSADYGWLVVNVEQVMLDEFFVGRTDTGRVMRLYTKRIAHETLLDAEGAPFEISGHFLLFGTLDNQPITINTISTRNDSVAFVVTPTGPIGAAAPGTNALEAKTALAELAQKAPIPGWQIDCVTETTSDDGSRSFILRVRNQVAEAHIEVTLDANVAAGWAERFGRPLEELVIANESRRLRRWSLRKIQEEGSHRIAAGIPLA